MGHSLHRCLARQEAESIDPLAPARRQAGATAVEYALLVAFIASVMIVAVTALGLSVQGLFASVEGFGG